MFKKEQISPDLNDPSRISHKSSVEGEVFSKNDFRLDGSFKGKMTCEKRVIIGKKGLFRGELNCENLIIEGGMEAEITVSQKTSINSTAKFKGNLSTHKLEVEVGAFVEGNCATHAQSNVPKLTTKKNSTTQSSTSEFLESVEDFEIDSSKITTKTENKDDNEVIAVENN